MQVNNKNLNIKMMITGVGGQGIVYITNILAEAALLDGVEVAVSEIHGLSQRGGVVTAGIGFGKYCTGFSSPGGIDFLLGLEPMETQRCTGFLHSGSAVFFINKTMAPYSVNAGKDSYPDIENYIQFLKRQIRLVHVLKHIPEEIPPVLGNICLLGAAAVSDFFPVSFQSVETAIRSLGDSRDPSKALYALHTGAEMKIEN